MEFGAGTVVPTVRHIGPLSGHAANARLVNINPRESAVSLPHDVIVASAALATLQAIDSCWPESAGRPACNFLQ